MIPGSQGATSVTSEPFPGRMAHAAFPGRLEGMTGDFLPQRRQASLLAQLLTIVALIAAAIGAWFLLT